RRPARSFPGWFRLRFFRSLFSHSWPSTPFFAFVGRVRTMGSTAFTSFLFRDLNRPNHPCGLRPGQIDRKQAILQVGLLHLHAVGQHESPLELTGGNAAVQVLPALVVL